MTRPKTLACALAALWLAACGGGSAPERGALDSGREQAMSVESTCDNAGYSLLTMATYTLCETANYNRSVQSLVEQSQPAFGQRVLEQLPINAASLAARAQADPSWLDPRSGNTPATPYCAPWAAFCMGDPFRHPAASGPDGASFYANEATVTEVVFYDGHCTRLPGHVWLPKNVPAHAELPYIVFVDGSVGTTETMYWWAAQALVRAGYAVLTWDIRGQGRADFMAPDGQLGTNLNSRVFWENAVNAIDFMHSSPQQPYPHNVACAAAYPPNGPYPTPMTAYNPIWDRLDRGRLGISGHSLGAIAVSVVAGYGAANSNAAPWPGLLDAQNPVKAVVALDALLAPDLQGGAPITNTFPPDVAEQIIIPIGIAGGALPKFGIRVPGMSIMADYGLAPNPHPTPPDKELHKPVVAAWSAVGLPSYALTFAGTTHQDFSPAPGFNSTSWCPDPSSGACRGGWAQPAIQHYMVAWFDRWLKKPNEAGYADADARLVDDAGPQGAVKMSWHFRSARDFRNRQNQSQACSDIRAGC